MTEKKKDEEDGKEDMAPYARFVNKKAEEFARRFDLFLAAIIQGWAASGKIEMDAIDAEWESRIEAMNTTVSDYAFYIACNAAYLHAKAIDYYTGFNPLESTRSCESGHHHWCHGEDEDGRVCSCICHEIGPRLH